MENFLRDSLIQDWIVQGDSLLKIVGKLQEKDIPTSKKTVSKVLKSKGFTYNSSTKEWAKSISNTHIIDSNINRVPVTDELEIIKIKNEEVSLTETRFELVEMLGFSQEEFITLKGIVKDKMQEDLSKKAGNSLQDDILKLKTFSDRKNKTFYASRSVFEGFAKVAEENGLKTSVAIELAMLNFIEKYST